MQHEIQKENMKGGIDILTGKAMLPSIEGVWDNYRVKRQFSTKYSHRQSVTSGGLK